VELGQLAGRVLRSSSIGLFAPPHDGTADRGVAEWLVRGPEGARCTVEVAQPRAGVVRVEIPLTATA
jgi:hypothetical protein